MRTLLDYEYQGATPMLTPKELRYWAKECLELANRTNEHYVKVSLKELAQKLHRDASQAERRGSPSVTRPHSVGGLAEYLN
jgi:hypothetical protein